MRFIFYILSVFWGVWGYGQVSVTTETNVREYEVSEPFKLNIGVEIVGQYTEQMPIKLPDLSKFEILGNASEMFSFVDEETGLLVKQMVHQLVLEPKQSGKIKIGSALVQVNGKIYKSEPFDIWVKEAKKTSELAHHRDVFLSLEALQYNVYENEPIRVVLRAYSKNFHQFRKVHQVKLPHQIKDIHPISLDKQEVEMNILDDFATQVLASFIVFPDKSGNFTIPPVSAKWNDENISSNALKINIKPLPKDAPKSFKNAVGKFELSIITPEKMVMNQANDVWVKLSGEGNLHEIALPKILESEDYQIFKPKKSIKTTAEHHNLHGEIVEHYIIIPKKEGEISLNVGEFSFFNPKDKEYQILQKTQSVEVEETTADAEKSALSQVFDTTEHILKKVDLVPTSEKKQSQNHWSNFIWISFAIVLCIPAIFWLIRKKNRKNKPKKSEKITTIAETEEKIRHSLFIGKEYYFRSIKNAIDDGNMARFYEEYEELHHDAQQQVELYEQKLIRQFLQETAGEDFAQEYEVFRGEITTAKYSPTPVDLYKFYNNIVKFYSKIMK